MDADALAVSFAAGMAAAVNPCGFALLPAYLSYYLGLADEATDDRPESTWPSVRRALWVSLALTLGFVVVFGVIGTLWSTVSATLNPRLPWITVAIGVAIVGLGVAMLAGFEPVVRTPHLDVGKGAPSEFWSVFVFGISYGVASLGCTIPIFLAVMTGTFDRSFGEGVANFVVYALGMGALIAALTLAVALARQGLVHTLRRLLPHMGRISGGLLVVAGALVVYAGWSEHQQLNARDGGTGLFESLQDLQGEVTDAIQRTGAGRVAAVLGVAVGATTLIAWLLRRRGPDGGDEVTAERGNAAPVEARRRDRV